MSTTGIIVLQERPLFGLAFNATTFESSAIKLCRQDGIRMFGGTVRELFTRGSCLVRSSAIFSLLRFERLFGDGKGHFERIGSIRSTFRN